MEKQESENNISPFDICILGQMCFNLLTAFYNYFIFMICSYTMLILLNVHSYIPLHFVNYLLKSWNSVLNSTIELLKFPQFQNLSYGFSKDVWRPPFLPGIMLSLKFLTLLSRALRCLFPMASVIFTLPIYLMARINLKNSRFAHCLFYYLQRNLHISTERSFFFSCIFLSLPIPGETKELKELVIGCKFGVLWNVLGCLLWKKNKGEENVDLEF